MSDSTRVSCFCPFIGMSSEVQPSVSCLENTEMMQGVKKKMIGMMLFPSGLQVCWALSKWLQGDSCSSCSPLFRFSCWSLLSEKKCAREEWQLETRSLKMSGVFRGAQTRPFRLDQILWERLKVNQPIQGKYIYIYIYIEYVSSFRIFTKTKILSGNQGFKISFLIDGKDRQPNFLILSFMYTYTNRKIERAVSQHDWG